VEKRSIIFAGLAIAVLVAFACLPAAAAWTYTSASPLLFQFADNDSSTYTFTGNGGQFCTNAESPNQAVFFNFAVAAGTWYATFSSADTGSLAIQRSSTPSGRLLLSCGSGDVGEGSGVCVGNTNPFTTATLSWANGIVFEVKAKNIGAEESAPEGYTWGVSEGNGGVEFSLGDGSSGVNSCLDLSFNSRDPVNHADDTIELFDHRCGPCVRLSVPYDLGGDATNPPQHTYKVVGRRSPLPLTPADNIVLCNVWVDGTDRPIVNRTVVFSEGDGPYFFVGQHNQGGPAFGVEYDWLKIYEADAVSDSIAPGAPTNLVVTAPTCASAALSWTAATDTAPGEIIGYRVYRNGTASGNYVGYSDTTIFADGGLTASTTYTYYVYTMDGGANLSATSASKTLTTPPCFGGNQLTFDFHDKGNTTIAYTSSPNYFYTVATEADGYYLGRRYAGTGADGSNYWNATNGGNEYKYIFESSGSPADGSLTIRTASTTNADNSRGRTFIQSSDFANWYRWIYRADYPNVGDTYIRGMSWELDLEEVGDQNGWCVGGTWGGNTYETVTLPGGGACPWTATYRHYGSDWGCSQGANRKVIMCEIPANKDLDQGMPGYGYTGPYTGSGPGGALAWVALYDADNHSAADDEVRFCTESETINLRIHPIGGPGLIEGFNLTPEDGTNPSYPRDGVITGPGNKIKLKIAVCPSEPAIRVDPPGTQPAYGEYWDIWLWRPGDANWVHMNKITAVGTGGDGVAGFGLDGHTWKTVGSSKSTTYGSLWRLGQASSNSEIWGMKFNSVKERNDWSGEILYHVDRLGDLRDSRYLGTIVTFDCATGGNKVVSNETTMSVDGATPYFYYVEQEDRSAGVRIMVADDADEPTRGDKVSVKGVVGKDADGNLYVDTTKSLCYCNLTSGGQVVAPLSLTNKAAGGKGVTGGAGAENAGLLAIVWGKVSNVVYTGGTGVLTFDLDDGSATPVSVADYAGDGQIAVGDRPVAGEYWKATGILALKKDGSDYKRLLIVDGVDVKKITP